MRTIKFRGKIEGVNEWAYGWLCNECTIQQTREIEPTRLRFCRFSVLPDTVGQFTGLCDKNGKEIYEGDILAHTFGQFNSKDVKKCIMIFDDDNCAFWLKPLEGISLLPYVCRDSTEWEIIGNIYDNPELLKEQDE